MTSAGAGMGRKGRALVRWAWPLLLPVAIVGACGPSSTVRSPAASQGATASGAVLPLDASAASPVSGAAHGAALLSLAITALPEPGIDALRLRVVKVSAHVSGTGWIVLNTTPVDVDLLRLAAPESSTALGWAVVPAGTVTQLRLLVAASTAERGTVDPLNYVVRSGDPEPLEVPSGEQSGVKIIGPFGIAPCSQSSFTLVLDTHRSLWVHRTGGAERWILRPVIRVHAEAGTPITCPGEAGGGGAAPLPAGTACERDEDCLSDACVDGACAPAGPGGSCGSDGDCASGTCVAGSCAPGAVGWTGASCSRPAECASGACVDGTCQPGSQGVPCQSSTDCIATLRCVAIAPYGGTCQPPSY